MFKKTIALLLLSLVLNINAFYLDSKHKATIQVKSDNVYTSDTNVPIVYKFNLGTPFLGNGQDIVITTTSDVLIPRTVDSLGSGEYAIYYKDPAQSATSGGTELLVQWGGASVNVANDLTAWQNCHGSTDDYVLVVHGEEASASLTDESGNYTATDTDVVYSGTGKIGKAPDFNSAGYSNFGDITQLNNVQNFTISFWIMMRDLLGNRSIFLKYVGAGNWLQLYANSSDKVLFRIMPGQEEITLSSNFTANVFSHVTYVYDGTKVPAAEKVKCIINGVDVPTTSSTASPATSPNMAGSDFILSNTLATPAINGLLDEFRIFTGSLTENQIKTQYDNQNLFSTNGSIIEGAIVLSRNKNMSKYNRPTYSKPIYKNDDYKNFIYNK